MFWLRLLLLLALMPASAWAINCGHRGGADCQYPENTIGLLKDTIINLQHRDNFRYLEFDVQETYDHQLVVFHDYTIGRLLPDAGANKAIFDRLYDDPAFKQRLAEIHGSNKLPPARHLRIVDLTIDELQSLYLAGVRNDAQLEYYQVPRLETYLQVTGDGFMRNDQHHRLERPMFIEIKWLYSDIGRAALLDQLKHYKSYFDGDNPVVVNQPNNHPARMISLLAFAKNFKYSYPDREQRAQVCRDLKTINVELYAAGKHEPLCRYEYNNPRTRHGVKRWIERLAVMKDETRVEQDVPGYSDNYDEPRLFIHVNDEFKSFDVSQTAEALQKLAQGREAETRNLVLWVHGRGNHPKKGKKIMRKLEERYGALVIMFNWDAWMCNKPGSDCKDKKFSNVRPSGNARAAAGALNEFITQASEYIKQNSEAFDQTTMLIHSMGNITLKTLVESQKTSLTDGHGFDNLILNAPDVALVGHAEWVDRIAIAERTFVTMSRGDSVLASVEYLLRETRLGQDYIANDGSPVDLSANAYYIDMSDVTSRHRRYLDRYGLLWNFYNDIISGKRGEYCFDQHAPPADCAGKILTVHGDDDF